MLIKFFRQLLGSIIVFVDWLTRPKPLQRSESAQTAAQESVSGLALYQLYACPFCVKTRRAIHKLNVDIEIRDIGKNTDHRAALEQGGGRIKVPCLKISDDGEERWLYESNDIIAYLNERLAVDSRAML